MLERTIEKFVTKYAENKGFLTFKFTSPAHRGVPDRMFITPSGKIFFLEFKQKGRKPTKLQDYIFNNMRQYHLQVKVIDDIIDGRKIIDENL